ncbi:MAG: BamA/TamA family outer membrane protein [Candidatus Delongbacteria bacterium]|nr:BamA/TamA family outer membrane protein [Candidatus Delongbacteria bacterium]MCG2760707.1 BamA/TamA family outer membrane protein [Candidatus Delongbacteria bacterium]
MRRVFKIFNLILIVMAVQGFAASLYSAEDISRIINAERISDIKFRKIHPFFSNRLLDMMSIYPGMIYDSIKVEGQAVILKEYFLRKGYDSVLVNINSKRISEKLFKVDIEVLKTGYYTLQKIELTGNKYYSNFRLKKEMRMYWRSYFTSESGRLIQDEYEADRKALEEFYRERGFADVEIISRHEKDSLKYTANVFFEINEGPKYRINISGNDFFYKGKLRDETDLIYKGRRGSVAARQIVRGIRQKYKDEGFKSIKVDRQDSVYTLNSVNYNDINILIKEGKRIIVKEINFKGNDSFTKEELKPYLNSVITRWWRFTDYFNQDYWEDDSRNLSAFYEQNGFLSTEINSDLKYSSSKDSVSIFYDIKEGIMTHIGNVEFSGTDSIITSEEEMLRLSLSGSGYNYGIIKDKTDYLKGLLASKGYIYVSSKNELEFSEDSSTVNIKFSINHGKLAATGKIYTAGNLKTKAESINKLMPVKEGNAFSILDLSKGQRNLRNQKIFRSVNVITPGMEFEKDTLDIIINVEEYPPYYIQSAGGYESSVGPYIRFLIGNKNLFGLNKEINVGTEVSFTRQTVTLGFIEPVLFHPNLTGNISAYWEREKNYNLNFETRILGSGTGLNYKWESKLQSIARLKIENRELFEKTEFDTDTHTVRNTGSLKLIQLWDSRDSFMRPKKGVFATFETEFSTGIDNQNDDFIRHKFDLKYFITPLEFVTVAFFGKLNFLQEMDRDYQPPVDQLFYLGGTGTVRGINENMFLTDAAGNSVGGKLSALISAEFRIEFKKNWEIPLFVDNGMIAKSVLGSKEETRTTIGSGIRYITPIGAMGVLYGFPTDIKDGYKNGVFHFSIGYTF